MTSQTPKKTQNFREFDWKTKLAIERNEPGFNIEDFIHQQLQKAQEEEKERLFKNPLELFRGNRIKMTIEDREALLMSIDVIPDHSELDQDKKSSV